MCSCVVRSNEVKMASTSSDVGSSKTTNLILSAIRAVRYLKLHSHALEDSILRRLIVGGQICSGVTYCPSCNDDSVEKCLRTLTLLTASELQLVLKKSVHTDSTSPAPGCASGKTSFKPSLDWKRRPPMTNYSYNLMKMKVKEGMARKYGKNNPSVAKLTVQEVAFFNPCADNIPRKRSSKRKDMLSENAAKKENNRIVLATPIVNKSSPVPQVKISDTGEVIIDPESLRFQTPTTLQRNENSPDVHREPLVPKIRWNFKDLVKFYRGLFLFGTDFSLLADFFPDRSRMNLKAKFKSEEKRNRDLVDRAVHSVKRSRADLAEIIRLLKVDRVLKSFVK